MNRPFIYNVPNATLIAPGGVYSQTVTISETNGFRLKEMRSTGTVGVKIQIKYTTGELMFLSNMDATIVGNGMNKIDFNGEDYIYPPNTQLEITYTNTTGGNIAANAFEVALVGMKLGVNE